MPTLFAKIEVSKTRAIIMSFSDYYLIQSIVSIQPYPSRLDGREIHVLCTRKDCSTGHYIFLSCSFLELSFIYSDCLSFPVILGDCFLSHVDCHACK